jgi:hypothetical protein
MLKSRPISLMLLVLLLGGFGWGVMWLFHLRFNAGDIYPPYSSFRADPLGAKALYESLQGIPSLSVRRFFQASSKLEGSPRRVLFLFGAGNTDLSLMPESDFKILQRFLFSGGRVVISLLPAGATENPPAADENPFKTFPPKPPAKPLPKTKSPVRGHTNAVEAAEKMVSFLDKNQLRLEHDRFFIPDTAASHAELADSTDAPAGLPAWISWHSAAYFDGLDATWRTLYQRRKHAVIIERSFGAGSLVLSTDSYFLSNEALRRERHAGLLAWLVGSHSEVLFDETHLGVQEDPGVAALIGQYHLEGVLLVMLLIAGLFVWKNSSPLVPPPPDEASQGRSALVQGRESTAGFASLLRRSIPPSEILAVSFAEWKAACARQPRAAARLSALEKIVEEEQIRSPRSRLPVQTWQSLQRILMERK